MVVAGSGFAGETPSDFPYIYRWDRCGRKGQRCKVTARGSLNSARVEFLDGGVLITSRNALKRAEPASKKADR